LDAFEEQRQAYNTAMRDFEEAAALSEEAAPPMEEADQPMADFVDDVDSMPVSTQFMAKGGPVVKTAREQMDSLPGGRRITNFVTGGAAYTADVIRDQILAARAGGGSEADIMAALGRYGVTEGQAAAALAPPKTYTPEKIQEAIAASRAAPGKFTDADIAIGLERYRVPAAQTAGLFTPAGTTRTPQEITAAIAASRAAPENFSEADIATGLQRYLPTAAAVTAAMAANPRTAVTGTGITNAGATGITNTGATTTGATTAKISPAAALALMYRSSTTGGPIAEFNNYGGYDAVKTAATAAGFSATPEWQRSYEQGLKGTGTGTTALTAIAPAPFVQTKATVLPSPATVLALPGAATNFTGSNLTGVQPASYSSILTSKPLTYNTAADRRRTGSLEQTYLSPDYTSQGVGAVGSVGGISTEG